MEKILLSFENLSTLELSGIFAFGALLLGFIYAVIRMVIAADIDKRYQPPQNRFKPDLREEEKQAYIQDIKNDIFPSFLALSAVVIIYLYLGSGF